MRVSRRNFLRLAATTAASPITSHLASAQTYPTRPIIVIIPFPAGGNLEIVARPLAERLSASLGQPVIIENRPGGAGGTIGTKAVANANPDGHTLLLTPAAALAIGPLIYRNLGYSLRNFVPVATLFRASHMLVVHPSLPVDSMKQLVDYTKANPGKVSYASPGYGTQPHLFGEMFKLETGADVVAITYKGAAPALTDLLAGQVQMCFDSIALFLPHVRAGKLKAIAVADDHRSDQLPDVPTTTESGFPEFQGAFVACVAAPASTPESIVIRLNQSINGILQSSEIETSVAKFGAKTRIGSPQELAAYWSAEAEKWASVIRSAGIKAE